MAADHYYLLGEVCALDLADNVVAPDVFFLVRYRYFHLALLFRLDERKGVKVGDGDGGKAAPAGEVIVARKLAVQVRLIAAVNVNQRFGLVTQEVLPFLFGNALRDHDDPVFDFRRYSLLISLDGEENFPRF